MEANAALFRAAAEVAAALPEPSASLAPQQAAAPHLHGAAVVPASDAAAAAAPTAGISISDLRLWDMHHPLFAAVLREEGAITPDGLYHFPACMRGSGKLLDALAAVAEHALEVGQRACPARVPAASSVGAVASAPRVPLSASSSMQPPGLGAPAARVLASSSSAAPAPGAHVHRHAPAHLPSHAGAASSSSLLQQSANGAAAGPASIASEGAGVRADLGSEHTSALVQPLSPLPHLLPSRRPRPEEEGSIEGEPVRTRPRSTSSAVDASAALSSSSSSSNSRNGSSAGIGSSSSSSLSAAADLLPGVDPSPLSSPPALLAGRRGWGRGAQGSAAAAAAAAATPRATAATSARAATAARGAATAVAEAEATAATARNIERERAECEAIVDDPVLVAHVDALLGQWFIPALLRYRRMESVYAADVRTASAQYKPDPGRDGLCEKQYPTKRSHTPGILSGYCMHGFMLFHTFLQDAESPVGVFRILYERFDVAPLFIVYDNACHLHRACISREPVFFRNTLFLVDRLHWGNHKNCSPSYSCNIYGAHPIIGSINTEVAEQAHSQLRRIATQVGFMTMPNAYRYLQHFFRRLNNNKLKRYILRCSRKGVHLEGPALTAALAACRLTPEMLLLMKQKLAHLNGGAAAVGGPAVVDELLDSIVEEAEGLQLGEVAADEEPEYAAGMDAVVDEVAADAEAVEALAVSV